jgi:hypothetical protein
MCISNTHTVTDAQKRANTKYRLKNNYKFCKMSRDYYHQHTDKRLKTLTIYRLRKGQNVKDSTLEKYGLVRSDYIVKESLEKSSI